MMTVRRSGYPLRGLRGAGLAALLMLGLCGMPASAADCRVLDAELQGVYTGPCVDGLAHGQGTAKGTARYVGAFIAGRKQGNGIKEWPNGDRYEGQFANDFRNGYGVYVWGPRSQWPGQRYSGNYVNDHRHGAGVYTWPDGRELAGQWQNDRPPVALPPAMQTTVRVHAERMAAVSRPGAKICRRIPVGITQFDVVTGIVQAAEGERIRIRIENAGRFGNGIDGHEITVGSEIMVYADGWLPCS